MGLLEILALFKAVLDFPSEIRMLVNILRMSPEEKRQEITRQIEAESDRLKTIGRPSWD